MDAAKDLKAAMDLKAATDLKNKQRTEKANRKKEMAVGVAVMK
jgi:hypothetical protein